MIEFIDIFFNQYLRIFVGIVLVGLILFSLYYNFKIKNSIFLKLNDKKRQYCLLMLGC